MNLFWKNQNIKSKRYCSQLDQQKVTLGKKRLENRKCIIFNQVNARPHVSLISRQKLLQLGWVVLISVHKTLYIWISLFQSLQNSLHGKKKVPIPWKTVKVTWNNYLLKQFWEGTSLVAQWLRISLPIQGVRFDP